MNSEEVKDIKKTVGYFADKYMTAQCIGVPKRELFAAILTLINELETENERLMKLQSRGGCRVAELGIENQQLKDRIAELENTDYYKEIAGKYLKEFAEKLKEKALSHCRIINCYELTFIEEAINELLKDYEK